MPKGRAFQTFLTISSGFIIVALLGSILILARERGWLARLENWVIDSTALNGNSPAERPTDERSTVLLLVSQTAEARRNALTELAQAEQSSFERSRARYLLASDWLAAQEGGRALRLLTGLEADYEVLAPYILLKRARARALTNERERMRSELEALIAAYPDSLVAAEALYYLGEFDPTYHDRALAEFPDHPRSQQIARDRLEGDRAQPDLLLYLVRQVPDGEGMSDLRDYLVENYADDLTADDWEAVAYGYWEQWEWEKAARAYAKAAPNAVSLYRTARGQHIAGNESEAARGYENLLTEFPDSEEAGQALLHLADVGPRDQAIAYLDRAIAEFPDHAPAALIDKADRFEARGEGRIAGQVRQQLLDEYPKSEAAARYRWQQARQAAEADDFVEAWKWAQPIALNTPDSSLAPKAAFWVGKWAQALDRDADAEKAFRYTVRKYPESYYAWRAASLLGWSVGDFQTVSQQQPVIAPPERRSPPPAGSVMLQELYQLGQDEDAWRLWQAELGTRRELTVEEQFTDGLIRVARGDYLKGIDQIWSLQNRETDAERETWQELRATPAYWQALFPLPYWQLIQEQSAEQGTNPVLALSLMRQESRFEPEIRSSAGAVGLMQVMPDTGTWVAEQAGYDSEFQLIDPADNIQLGTWFLAYTHREYEGNSMLAIASYNAGPGNVNDWVQRFGYNDPDVFVEQIPFPETKGYVESVFSNYWNYLRLYDPEISARVEN
ncbi:MAG: transglycosylase SLT domain-containing protein [Spirulinaceae cyanobacterium SM2_1_0]|nr:transglycosylase SLT domain-containing protein [Spirulinaceae cyanobacterium SM2_1_0]